tara:strand:+ start:156 stop:758 length:603 start_codon:yes stop_codon:yes gene_type:complete
MKRLIKLFASLILLVASGCSGGCANSDKNVEDIVDTQQNVPEIPTWEDCGYGIGDNPCNFTLEDIDGNNFELWNQYGNVVVLDFSTMWCGYCQVAAGTVQQVQDLYGSQGFNYVTILIEDHQGNSVSLDEAQIWADHFGITSAPVLISDRTLLDPNGQTGWPIVGWPTFVVIDREMVIHTGIRGFSEELLISSIEEAISQ